MLFLLPDAQEISEQEAVLRLMSSREISIAKSSRIVALIVRYVESNAITKEQASGVLNHLLYGPPVSLSFSAEPSQEHEKQMLPLINLMIDHLRR